MLENVIRVVILAYNKNLSFVGVENNFISIFLITIKMF